MDKSVYTLTIYNTLTGKYEEIAVTKEIYTTYKRTEWNIKDNNKSFYNHEIQMSSLIGGEAEQLENFHEFIDGEHTPENTVIENGEYLELIKAMHHLNEQEKELIQALFFDQMKESEYAAEKGVSQQYISKRKQKILKKLKIFLEKRL